MNMSLKFCHTHLSLRNLINGEAFRLQTTKNTNEKLLILLLIGTNICNLHNTIIREVLKSMQWQQFICIIRTPKAWNRYKLYKTYFTLLIKISCIHTFNTKGDGVQVKTFICCTQKFFMCKPTATTMTRLVILEFYKLKINPCLLLITEICICNYTFVWCLWLKSS